MSDPADVSVSVGACVGAGAATFDRLTRCITNWSMHRKAGVRVSASGPATVGQVVTVGMGPSAIRLSGQCEIEEITDSDGYFALTYRTLDGHPENGVESYELRLDSGGFVWATVSAVSHPEHALLRRVPKLALLGQQFFADRYVWALRVLARP